MKAVKVRILLPSPPSDNRLIVTSCLSPGHWVTVEGPYDGFTFDDSAERQIWIGAGLLIATAAVIISTPAPADEAAVNPVPETKQQPLTLQQ